jgi:hypothetical protein
LLASSPGWFSLEAKQDYFVSPEPCIESTQKAFATFIETDKPFTAGFKVKGESFEAGSNIYSKLMFDRGGISGN